VAIVPHDLKAAGASIGVDGHRCRVAHASDRTPSVERGRVPAGPSGPGAPTGPPAILRRMSLEIDHVTKRYGQTTALDGLAFEVARGEVFGFLGANGAGKTTTMRICLGIIEADAGQVRWSGRPTAELPRRMWGYLPEERGLYARMGVLDQLVYFATLYGQTPDRARRDALAWLTRFHIADYAGRRAEELSKGNQQKVQFIAAVLHGPEVLLMDEPFTGLDPVNLVLLREAFVELRDQGRTLIFSTHQMELAEALCESVAIVDHGRLVAGGRLRDLKRASGRRSLRLAFDGELATSWLAALPGVAGIRPGRAGTELELLPGADPDALLAAVLRRGVSITRFELVEPSLEALFLEHVGRPPEDVVALAPAAVASAMVA
jgi:ABC-2 type transport system ATP-binding protein